MLHGVPIASCKRSYVLNCSRSREAEPSIRGRSGRILDAPKSAILIVKSERAELRSRLASLMSRWHTPCEWRYAIPLSTWCMHRPASASFHVCADIT